MCGAAVQVAIEIGWESAVKLDGLYSIRVAYEPIHHTDCTVLSRVLLFTLSLAPWHAGSVRSDISFAAIIVAAGQRHALTRARLQGGPATPSVYQRACGPCSHVWQVLRRPHFVWPKAARNLVAGLSELVVVAVDCAETANRSIVASWLVSSAHCDCNAVCWDSSVSSRRQTSSFSAFSARFLRAFHS